MITTINKLFRVEYGQKEYENKQPLEGEEGDGILISSKGEDNGVYGFFNIRSFYKAPFITVPRVGTIGQAFVQKKDCSVDNNCLVLIPKKQMTLEELYEVALQIRMSRWKYKYGRQITPERLEREKVALIDFKKDWKKFESVITPSYLQKSKEDKFEKIKVFKLKKIMTVIKGEGSYLENLDEGKTPIVSTKMSDNGVCGFYDIEPTFEKFCITVGRIMCNPRVQIVDFATVPDDMFVLEPIDEVPKEVLFYVSSIIKTEKWRFNYSRKVTKEKLEELDIPLPMKGNKIDFSYIKSIAKNSYGFGELKRTLE